MHGCNERIYGRPMNRDGGRGPGRPKHFAGHGPFGGRSDGEHSRGPFGGGGFGGHRGGGRRGKRFAGDELRLMVLGLLESGPQHGYQLIRAFAEKSNEAYTPSPGVLYPLLTLLQDMALVEEAPGEGRSRSFELTDAGKAELETNREKLDAAFARLAALGDEADRADPAPIRRAMMNLRTAAMQRMLGGEADKETAFAIADILDEAARKIERL